MAIDCSFTTLTSETPEIVCLSNLRCNSVHPRLKHILSRCTSQRRVFFIEQVIFTDQLMGRLDVRQDKSGLVVVIPSLPKGLSEEKINAELQKLLNAFFRENHIDNYIFWYCTSKAIAFTRNLQPQAVIYDCMDELPTIKSIPPTLQEYESEMFSLADLVFIIGEKSSQAIQVHQHPNIYAFPSSGDCDRTWNTMMKLIDFAIAARQNEDTSHSQKAIQGYKAPETCKTDWQFDYLIVGAGFAGSVMAERLASQCGKKVLVVDKRNHIGGNAYDYYNHDGILVHKYGPHIFHTNSQEVFKYLSQFTQWRPYQHRVLSSVDGQMLPLPINLDTINQLYGMNLNSFEVDEFFKCIAEPKEYIRTSEDVIVSKVGKELYKKFFQGYTRKQWGLDPSELDKSVITRVPTRTNRDNRYFTDTYQAMPLHGYTRMFEKMLDHPNIKVMLNTDYREIEQVIPWREMVYTGAIDEFFDYRYGKLPYRSMHFQHETHNTPVFQPAPVINYPNEHLYTRVTEFKYLTGQEHNKTTIVYEFPQAEGEPYYPVPRPENYEIYTKYKALADSMSGVYFVGRLATYKYYNMDQCVAQALSVYQQIKFVEIGKSTATRNL
ncbi:MULTISPECIES: UDP-galactopyranose mutase [unclassified Nodularia (in: cyanobacteria)]|uniref:UDP-galactopyranose mutase n=1 Tax=unclassified Nodularia (in: cyanobacteria) TaxID=2656917 RepID=UPI001881E33B|nr:MULTISPECIES: UDP-galactopyranose mutase [unclassified Nodularia (in: cyanobacteria)]MBE9199306.1 UDP-galactopyranose mutase [Nodularia sp. LEGE 06071]MCC2693676.1 UDP-galactopyranose mutase [Nodularia sp. LEGE 04288]